MLEHKAEVILDAIAERLKNLSTTGFSVKRARSYPWEAEELPALSMFMGEDGPVEVGLRNIATMDCNLVVYFETVCAALQYSHVEKTLNAVRAEVLSELNSDRQLGLSFVIDLNEQSAERPEISIEGSKTMARQIFSIVVKYRRNVDDPRL